MKAPSPSSNARTNANALAPIDWAALAATDGEETITSGYVEVEPGSGFLVRDLIQGGEPLRVSERSASQTLKQWDRIGARVVQVGGK